MVEQVIVGIYSENGIIPEYKYNGDSGMDICAKDSVVIKSKEWGLVKTGLYFNIPEGYEIQVRPRSGLALKDGITVLNTPGTIDSCYKGELCVNIINHSPFDFKIEKGDRICQIVLQKVPKISWLIYNSKDQIEVSSRGENGFGSTGK
jgi:dUTP pyrophosphatase